MSTAATRRYGWSASTKAKKQRSRRAPTDEEPLDAAIRGEFIDCVRRHFRTFRHRHPQAAWALWARGPCGRVWSSRAMCRRSLTCSTRRRELRANISAIRHAGSGRHWLCVASICRANSMRSADRRFWPYRTMQFQYSVHWRKPGCPPFDRSPGRSLPG